MLLKNGAHPQPLPKGGESGQLLPLDFSKYKNVLVVGENATRSLTQGGGSSELKTLKDVSPFDGLSQAITSQLGKASGVRLLYAQGYASGRALYDHVDKVSADQNARLKAEAIEKAKEADLIIYIGGLNKNHKQDCENGDRESYNLSFGQNELIQEISNAKPRTTKLVVVMFGGNPYSTPWLSQADALLHCWYLGSEAGTALANVLTGKVCPSGKLPVTFARQYDDYPYVKYGQEAYPGVPNGEGKRGSQVYYKEDVFVGYRGFERNKTKALFPFGFGLSYTTFAYDKPTVSLEGDNIVVHVSVSNTGSVAGKEVAQVYVSAPKNKQMEKPVKELKAFAKTRLLQPGESQTLRMTIPRRSLASWSEALHDWQLDSGTYTVLVGANSADIKGRATVKL